MPALLVSSCEKVDVTGCGPVQEVRDSAVTRITFTGTDRPVERLDVFIYETAGVQGLEKHLVLDSLPPSLEVYISKGDKLIAAVANSPRKFKETAMSRYSAVSQISYLFSEDSPTLPIMSGSAESIDQEAEIELRPMLCEVVLGTVTNTMEDYELLEEPRVRLRGINSSVKFFGAGEFLPEETIDKGAWADLPRDVGYYPEQPGTILYCYPNETPESNIGQDRTSLELECLIKGIRRSFTVDLPPLGRGAKTEVEITVDGPGAFSYEVKQDAQ